MSDSPFTVHGDETLEARIVAWVLGEASAFEAAELERLCEERPELLVFRRRMRALHGLLTEAEAQQPDESWKLPPEKRKVLDEIFGGESVVRLDPEKETRIRHSGRHAFLAIAACLVLTAVILRLMPWKQVAEAEIAIEVKSRSAGMSPLGSQMSEASGANKISPEFFGTEFEKIKSRNNLEKVVDNLELTQRWGVDKETALQRVKNSIQTQNIRGTDLISIRVQDPNQTDAKDIAGEVAKNYKAYRNESENRNAEQMRQELEKAVRDQEDKVEERRKVLATIVRTKGIIYKGNDSFYGQSAVDEDQGAKNALQTFHNLEQEKMQLESQISSLNKYDSDQLMVYAGGLDLPNNIVRQAFPLYQQAKRDLEGLKVNGLGADHPSIKAAEEETAKLKRQLDAGIVDARATLKAKLDLATESLKGIEVAKDETREEAIKRGLDAQDYADAKREFETDQELLQTMKLKLIGEEITGKMPRESVEIHSSPVIKEKNLSLLEGAVTGMKNLFQKDQEAPAALASAPAKRSAASAGEQAAMGGVISDRTEQSLAINDASIRSLDLQETDARRAPRPSVAPPPAAEPATAMVADPSAGGLASRNTRDRSAKGNAPADAEPALPDMDLAKLQTKGIANSPGQVRAGAVIGFAQSESNLDFYSGANGGSGGGFGGGALKADQPMEYALRFDDGERFHSRAQADTGELSKQLEPPAAALPSEARAKSEIVVAGKLMAGEKKMKEVEKMPVLGERMLADGTKFESNFTTNGTFNEGWSGKTSTGTVVSGGGTLQIDGIDKSNFGTLVPSEPDSFFDTSKVAESKPGGTEYEIHTGSSSEYLFKAEDLGKSDAFAPTDKESGELAMADEKGVKRELEEGDKDIQSKRRSTVAPKPDLTKLMAEIAATEDPYSTFSLNISDASFQVAQAALAKGERPDPAGIKVEQFYNAVDYGDPAPAAGEPVAVNIEQSAHPVIPGRNLVRVALKTAAAGRSAAQPLRLTLLVDQSGSMVREDRHAAMDKALAGLGGLLTDKDLVTVVGFSRTPRLIADGLTGDKAGKLAELVNQSASEGGTNLEEAIKLAGQMAENHKLAGAQNRIVLFTDGAANLGNADPAKLAEKVKQLRQKGIAFDIAGIAAEDLNDDLLGELARNGNGRYYVVGKGGDDNFAKQLAGAFRPAAENVKVQVHFNPERVGRYKLIGFEKDRLKTEDFRNDAVDAAEMAAEEAGVAIYQVEPLPDGRGELGEVSVRFRDTAANEMVERTWTIRHEAAAPVFDRAAPSMQLATLAMLAAEKLKGGPLSEAIDFKQLAEPSANVKRFYGSTGRPGDVLRMVDALK